MWWPATHSSGDNFTMREVDAMPGDWQPLGPVTNLDDLPRVDAYLTKTDPDSGFLYNAPEEECAILISDLTNRCLVRESEERVKETREIPAGPLTVEQAREHKVCRVCRGNNNPRHIGKFHDSFVLNYGKEYAHRSCLSLEAFDAGDFVTTREWIDSIRTERATLTARVAELEGENADFRNKVAKLNDEANKWHEQYFAAHSREHIVIKQLHQAEAELSALRSQQVLGEPLTQVAGIEEYQKLHPKTRIIVEWRDGTVRQSDSDTLDWLMEDHVSRVYLDPRPLPTLPTPVPEVPVPMPELLKWFRAINRKVGWGSDVFNCVDLGKVESELLAAQNHTLGSRTI
jgi:hypothetical protein